MKFRFIYTALSFLLITGIGSYGQSPGNFSIETGLDNYPLGAKEPENDSLLMKPDGSENLFNGVKYVIYFYKNTQEKPYKLAEVDFKLLFLTYGNGKLGTIEFSKIYTIQLYPDFEIRAKDEFEKLYAYFKEQLKIKAKKKKYTHRFGDNVSRYLQYEWDNGTNVLTLKLDWFVHPTRKTYNISLSLMAKETP